jgi:hypothetical protein
MSQVTTNPNVSVSFRGAGTYAVQDIDPKTGAVTGNERQLSEDELNRLLAAHGLRVRNGALEPLDGFTLAPNAKAIIGLSGRAPELPPVEGPRLPIQELQRRVTSMDEGDRSLAFMILSVLADSEALDIKSAKEIRDFLKQSGYAASEEALKSDMHKIAKERDSARTNFAWGMAAALASFAAGWAGGNGSQLGAAFGGASMALGNTVNQLGAYLNKTYGDQKEADDAGIESKKWELMSKRLDDMADNANNNYRESSEVYKKTLQLIRFIVESDSSALRGALQG